MLYYNKNNYCYNNYHFDGATSSFGDAWLEFSVNENNLEFEEGENPLFVNPTFGDYRIREDADFAEIPYEKIGRY